MENADDLKASLQNLKHIRAFSNAIDEMNYDQCRYVCPVPEHPSDVARIGYFTELAFNINELTASDIRRIGLPEELANLVETDYFEQWTCAFLEADLAEENELNEISELYKAKKYIEAGKLAQAWIQEQDDPNQIEESISESIEEEMRYLGISQVNAKLSFTLGFLVHGEKIRTFFEAGLLYQNAKRILLAEDFVDASTSQNLIEVLTNSIDGLLLKAAPRLIK